MLEVAKFLRQKSGEIGENIPTGAWRRAIIDELFNHMQLRRAGTFLLRKAPSPFSLLPRAVSYFTG